MKKKLFLSISIQISIFLVIVAFLPVAIMMALKTYEKQQLSMLENSNVQQGRIIAAALADKEIDENQAERILKNMKDRFDSRIRILDREGNLVVDSATLMETAPSENKNINNKRNEYDSSSVEKPSAERSIIYRIFSYPIRVYRKFFRPPVESLYDNADFYNEKKYYQGEEVQLALSGKYGAKTRISSGDQVSVTLYSAIPISSSFDDGEGTGESEESVCGVVLVSRSTYKILQNLYELRLDLAKIFLRSLIVIILIAVFLAVRVSWPMKKLSKQASDCADLKGHIIFTDFAGQKRRDEIGELSRSFTSLIERLNKRIKFSQAFSSDISHEFKNPLAAIRTSAEVLSDSQLEQSDRQSLSSAIISEVDNLQTLLNGVRSISKIDAAEDFSLQELVPIPVNEYVRAIISKMQNKYPDVNFIFESASSSDFKACIPEEYIYRIAENLIDNAASFADKVVIKTQAMSAKGFSLCVEDNGKGISDASKEKIFDRFYSERPESSSENHTGLGLSIVKAIVDVMEGQVLVENSQSLGGAKFTVSLKTDIILEESN